MKKTQLFTVFVALFALFVPHAGYAQIGSPDPSDDFGSTIYDSVYLNTDDEGSSCLRIGSGGGGTLPEFVPEPWRSLILSTSADFPDVDPRLVAATLWAENRGWPDYDKDWGVSHAGAAGPWQFIESTWRSMMPEYTLEQRNDPAIAVIGAFRHNLSSLNLPILIGYTEGVTDPDLGFENLIFNRKEPTLMWYMAKYNGNGAPSGKTLSDFPRNENSDYVRMGYWLIATNFETGWNPESDEFVDALTYGDPGDGGEGSQPGSPAGCAGGGAGYVNSEGYAFPVGLPKADISSGYDWPCTGTCHHDGTPAFDLAHKDTVSLNDDDKSVGVPIYAIRDGRLERVRNSYKGEVGCQSLQLVAKDDDGESDGYWYWYGHIQGVTGSNGQEVAAGEQIATIGERRCTGNGSYPHLHIDRGFPEGTPGGSDSERDPDFIPLMNKLYEELPS